MLVGEETESEWYIWNSGERILGHTLGFVQVDSQTSSAMLTPNSTQAHEHLLSTYWDRPGGKKDKEGDTSTKRYPMQNQNT